MKIIHQPADLANGSRKACLAIGMFDGVHLGHQQVLRQAIEDSHRNEGRSVAVTFDRHPASVIAPDRTPALLQTRAQRLRAIESLGIDAALLIEFDTAFSRKPGAEFVRELADGFGTIHSICVGANFTFGHRRDGNVGLLRTLGQADDRMDVDAWMRHLAMHDLLGNMETSLVTGDKGGKVVLQFSENLDKWTDLQTYSNESGQLWININRGADAGRLFFRVRAE